MAEKDLFPVGGLVIWRGVLFRVLPVFFDGRKAIIAGDGERVVAQHPDLYVTDTPAVAVAPVSELRPYPLEDDPHGKAKVSYTEVPIE